MKEIFLLIGTYTVFSFDMTLNTVSLFLNTSVKDENFRNLAYGLLYMMPTKIYSSSFVFTIVLKNEKNR